MAESTGTVECKCKPKGGDGCIHSWHPPRWGFLSDRREETEENWKLLQELESGALGTKPIPDTPPVERITSSL